MSRSFRESYLGRCRKPWRSWRKDPKPVRKLRRKLDAIYDDEEAILPLRLNRRWMGLFSWRQWQGQDYAYRIARRSGRKFLLKRKDFEPDEYYWSRKWMVFKK